MPRRILFVTYGGGHVRMVLPVIEELRKNTDIHIDVVALTTARPLFQKLGLSYLGFKDLVQSGDEAALEIGKKLAQGQHDSSSGIEEEESIAYLGLSYWDLEQRVGKEEAKSQWESKGRHAFLPVSILKRAIDRCRPDLVIATNSPRSERAALDAARAQGIPTLCMVDLFGYVDFHVLKADYYTVLSEETIDTLISTGITEPRDHFFVTGNPAFDGLFDYRGPINYTWRKEHFPAIPYGARCVLWIDLPAYFRIPPNLWTRNDDEIIFDINNLADAAAKNNAWMLVRPHPSQNRYLHECIMQSVPKHVLLAKDVPLYPLLNAVDVVATYASTVTAEAVLMEKPLLQLRYFPEDNGMPLSEWGMAWPVRKPELLANELHSALYDEQKWKKIKSRIGRFAPTTKAAPLVAEKIQALISA